MFPSTIFLGQGVVTKIEQRGKTICIRTAIDGHKLILPVSSRDFKVFSKVFLSKENL
jgi:hypothetical protein